MKPVYPVRTPSTPVSGNNKIAYWSAMLPSAESQSTRFNGVYAKHASKKFNEYLHNVLERIAVDTKNALGENLVALMLGGGYGRGEGGIVVRDGKERPYNDIDFTLVVKNKRKLSENLLLEISKKYEKEIKIHVDFSRPLTISDIKDWPHSLMWQDLIKGHKVLAGAEDIFQLHAHRKLLKPLPAIEATRLLLNRGSGILWALRVTRGLETTQDKDFVRRNYFKCVLSLGDALMILYRCYESNYHGRHDRFVRLVKKSPELASFHLEEIYKSSLDFKFRPDALPDEPPSDTEIKNLIRLWKDIFLFVENKRTGKNFLTLLEYSKWNGLREADENKFTRWSRNIIRNIQNGKFSLKYPREALFRKLPALLDSENCNNLKWDKESRSFLTVWERFN